MDGENYITRKLIILILLEWSNEEMGRQMGRVEEIRNGRGIYVRKLLGDRGVDGREILKLISEKEDVSLHTHTIKPVQRSLNVCFCVSGHRLPDSISKKDTRSSFQKLVSSAPKFRGSPYNSRSHSDIEEGGV